MIQIKDKAMCSGCTACTHVCAKHCISMRSDNEGFLYPYVEQNSCNNCRLCEKVCPVTNQYDADNKFKPTVCYAVRNNSVEERLKSSSGGVFVLLAKHILAQGGIVVGASFSDNWDVVHKVVKQEEELDDILRSKYLQSELNDIFPVTKAYLKENIPVLFSGTPCQVSGLKHYLNKEYDNLITVDFICHGVPSNKVFQCFINSISTNRTVESINFRDKSFGWEKYRNRISFSDNSVYSPDNKENPYMQGFLYNLYLRPSCHHCHSKGFNSSSDIKFADFWGINQKYIQLNDKKGSSFIMINSSKGELLFHQIQADKVEIPYIEGAKHQHALYSSFKPHRNRNFFFDRYSVANFSQIVFDLTKATQRDKMKQQLNKVLYLPKKITKKIIANNMKIGILTLKLHFNYGGILQAYALQNYLKGMGHEVWLIDQACQKPSINLKSIAKYYAKRVLKRKIQTPNEEVTFSIISSRASEFIRKYINPVTYPIYNSDYYPCLKEYAFDAIIVGSDQVWSKKFGGSQSFFLNFADDSIKKIAYAASFGEEKWLFSSSETQQIRKLAAKFKAISVREDSGVALCNKYLNMEAQHVLDPTMLLQPSDYYQLCIREQASQSKGEMMLYMLDEKRTSVAYKAAIRMKMKPFSVRSKTEAKDASLEDRIFPPVTEWIKGFYDAKFIITDSFHGAIFSILFNKQFVVVEHAVAGNARMESLLKMFGLKERMIYKDEDLTDALLAKVINYEEVNAILKVKREEALQYLRNALNG